MEVFISWSGAGTLSEGVANVLHEWLPVVLQRVKPWMSSRDIAAGSRWADELAKRLDSANVGILCLTQETASKPWVLFEAGALSKSISEGSVVPLLIDASPDVLVGPLGQFQCRSLDSSGVWSMLTSLNSKLDERLSHEVLRRAFELTWPGIANRIDELRNLHSHPSPSVSNDDLAAHQQQLASTLEDRLTRIENRLLEALGDRPHPVHGHPITIRRQHVIVSGNAGRHEFVVGWADDLRDVLAAFAQEMGAREYQLMQNKQASGPLWDQVQRELDFATGIHRQIDIFLASTENGRAP